MAQLFDIHPQHPQPRSIHQAAEIIRGGGLAAFPTDSAYALGGHVGDAPCSTASAAYAAWTCATISR